MGHVKRLMALTAAAAVLLVGLVSVAAAQSSDAPPAEATPIKVVSGFVTIDRADSVADRDVGLTHGYGEGDECFGDWEPSAEEIAEINAEHDVVVAHLEGLGFTVTVATDDLGIRYIDFDENADEALLEAMDDFYKVQWAEEVAGWSDEEKAEHNAYVEGFIADLGEEGITVESEEIAPGVIDIVWTEELDRALMELEGDLFFDEPFEDDWAPSAHELAEINAEHDTLVAHLEALGFTVTVSTDDLGFRYIDFEAHGDDEALWDAVDEYYGAQFTNDVANWSDDEKAEWNAHIEEFVADLVKDGITVETEEIAPGVIDIVWTEVLEQRLIELEGDEFPFGEQDCVDWIPGPEELTEINAETDALVAHLEELGYNVTVAEDEGGFRYIDFEAMGDDEALWEAVDDFYRQRFADEIADWPDAEKAEWNAQIDEIVADLAAAGVTVETEEIAPGVYDIVWNQNVEAQLAELDGEVLNGFLGMTAEDVDA